MNFRKFFKSKKHSKTQKKLTVDNMKGKSIPRHIAIIMDGNGRWAQKKGLPRSAGHRQGVERVRDIIKTSSELGIEYLTLYAFSTENWKRPEQEVNAIMLLLVEYLKRELNALHKNHVRIIPIGDISLLPAEACSEIKRAVKTTQFNKGLQVNIALNYGGRLEIVEAIKEISSKVMNNELKIEDIDEKLVSQHLYTGGIPDPDLLIRTGGDSRISNFLLYQIAYTELWFSSEIVYWPDFDTQHYLDAILGFLNRQRRYGDVVAGEED